MHLHLIEITDPGLAYIVIGGFVVAFSMVSLLVKEKLYINEVVLGTACGVIFGPYCANIFNPRAWGGDVNIITLEVMRLTLAAGLFAIGVELPQSYLAQHAKGLLVMVVPTMAFGWLVVAAIIFVVFPSLNFISSMVIAACLTPTDPIISAAIVGGKFATKHVPLNLRRLLSAESAANDGLAYPFLSISIYLTIEQSRRVAISKWFLVGWLYQVILGTLIGALLGIAFSRLMQLSHRKGFIDRESYVSQYLALALFTVGVTRTLGSDDLLAAFAAGSAISWDGHFNTQVEGEVFSTVIDLMLNCGCFIYIGAWMPFNLFNEPSLELTPWRLIVVFLAVMALRRIPPLLLLYRWVPEINSWREALFSGHFGPMGVGAVFISTLAVTELPTPQSPPQGQAELLAATLQPVVAFVVLGSIIIHGMSIPFFSFGRNMHSRTVSLSRTWTSRNATTPDWLLWARRTPAEVTRPTGDRSDIEQGIEEVVDPAGTTDAIIIPQDDILKKDHVPELGPAAMISGVTKNDLSHVRRRLQPSATASDSALTLPAQVPSEEGFAGEKVSDVKVTYAEVGNEQPSAAPSRALSPNASSIRVAPASVGEDLGDRQVPSGRHTPNSNLNSGAQTPSSPRIVRFPVGDELATYFEKDCATTGNTGPVKAVRFPESVEEAHGDDGALSSIKDGAEDAATGQAEGSEVGGGGVALGRKASITAAQ